MASIYIRTRARRTAAEQWTPDPKAPWRYIALWSEGQRGRIQDNLNRPPYYTRKDGGWKPLAGDTLDAAKESLKQIAAVDEAVAKGVRVVEEGNGTALSQAIAAYLEETQSNKSHKTWLAYKNSLNFFTDFATGRIRQVQDVQRSTMLAFKTYLKNQDLSARSIYNNFLNVMVFFKWAGVKTGVRQGDWPNKPEREPEAYEESEVKALLTAANPEERLLLRAFLCSGLRSGEIANLTYGDIRFINSKDSIWTVRPKAGWNPKTKNSARDVPVSCGSLTSQIRERMEKQSKKKTDLIFPNGLGQPNHHMLRIVKRVALRAGLTSIRVDDHKFRSTTITLWLRDGIPPQDVMSWVGHGNLDTILRYAAKLNVRKPATFQKAGAPLAQFDGVGD